VLQSISVLDAAAVACTWLLLVFQIAPAFLIKNKNAMWQPFMFIEIATGISLFEFGIF